MNAEDSSYIAVCYDCLWLIDHSRTLIFLFYEWIGRILTGSERPSHGQIITEIKTADGWRCRYAYILPPGMFSAGRLLRPLIGRRPCKGGSAEQTSYIRQDLRANQSVAAVPVTGSLVCISWLNLRDTAGTVNFSRRRTSGGTGFQVWLQMITGDCNMDTAPSVLPWDAPQAVVNVSLASVEIWQGLPDVMGLESHTRDATQGRILQGRDPRSIRVLIPDGRGPDQNIHDVTIVDMGKLPEPHVPIMELAKLIHRWPPAVINHMTWRQREIKLMCRAAKTESKQKHLRPCTFCGAIIKTDMYRHQAWGDYM